MPASVIASAVISESAKVAVKPVFERFVEPHLAVIKGWLVERKLDKKVDLFESEFIEYLGIVYVMTEFMNVLIYPNSQIRLDDFYEPLHIVSSNRKESYKIDKGNIDFLLKYKKVIISDAAGMGKSTIMKWITRQCVTSYLGIPILIELKKITQSNSLIQEIFNQFGQLGKELDNVFITKLLSLGKFVIILDGYDEIAQNSIDFVTNEIITLVTKAKDNYFIITSRPDPSLASFGNFKGFSIQPLSGEQYDSIIRKCDVYSPEPIGEDLIKDARVKGSTISDFLTNPFLVTLLYKCYFYNRNIPVNKSSFYEEIYTALFKRHDLSKEKFERIKRSGLDIYNFRLVLRKFAFNSAKIGDNDFSESSLIQAIKVAKETLVGVPDFDPVYFYEDLIKQVPLMVRDGLHIKWSHKSLQDYFAAESVCHDENKVKIIENIYNSKNFYRNSNLFDFIIEQDYALVREHILYKILIDYKNYFEGMKSLNINITEQNLQRRTGFLFKQDVFLLQKTEGIDDKVLEKIQTLSKHKVSSIGFSSINLNGELVAVYTASSRDVSILRMIESKHMDKLSLDFVEPRSKRFVLKDMFHWNNEIINIGSDNLLAIKDNDFQNTITEIIAHANRQFGLNHIQCLKVLNDIEIVKAKKESENEVSF